MTRNSLGEGFYLVVSPRRFETASVRPKKKLVKRPDPNISVRIPLDDMTDLHALAAGCQLPLKRFVAVLSREIFDLMLDIPHQPEIIRQIRKESALREKAALILRRGIRTLPAKETLPTRIHFAWEERDELQHISGHLNWTQGFVVWQAIMAALALATEEQPGLPDLLRHYWALRWFDSSLRATAVDRIQARLGDSSV